MHISAPFIKRPVGTMLLTLAVMLAGIVAYHLLPVGPLPDVDFPTIQVSGGLPGASPETMASAVATPLERQFGRIAGITEMTSTSMLGSTNITLQFDLNRNIDAAARDVQAAINAAAGQLPAGLPSLPNYRKVNPADAPILMLGARLRHPAREPPVRCRRLHHCPEDCPSERRRTGHHRRRARPAVRVDVEPHRPCQLWPGPGGMFATAIAQFNANEPKGSVSNGSDPVGFERQRPDFRCQSIIAR